MKAKGTNPKVQHWLDFCHTGSLSVFVLTWMFLVLFVSSLSSSVPLVSKHCSEHSWAVASLSAACGRLSKMFISIRNTLFQATLPPLLLLNSIAGAPELIGGVQSLTMSHFFLIYH